MEEHPATVVIIYPTGMQEAACDDCARYWINLRPHQTRLAPLSSYQDHYAQARAAMEAGQAQAETERQNLEALRSAFTTCPQDVLRRIAEGDPKFADWRVIDLLMGLDEHQADRRLADGTYRRMTAQVHGNAVAGTPAPIQLLASQVLGTRKPAAIEATPEQASSPPGQGPGRHSGAPRNQHAQRAVAGLICMALSIPVLIWGGITFWQGGSEEVANSGSATGMGVFLLLLGLAMLILPPVIAIARSAHQAHEHWISQYPAWKQAQIRRAERAAAWGLTTAAAVALHESNQRLEEKLSASVIGTGLPPGKVGAAMWAARQKRRAEQAQGRQHQELLDAIRQSGQPQMDPGQQLLANSRRNREYHATGYWNHDLSQY